MTTQAILDWTIAERLERLGWLSERQCRDISERGNMEMLEFSVLEYQRFHGLDPTGELDAHTIAHLFAPRFCQLPDTFNLTGSLCRWPMTKVTWDLVAPLPQLTMEKQVGAVRDAAAAWMAVCGVELVYTPGLKTAMIQISHEYIDGPGGILAQSELPCPVHIPAHQQYDSGEHWDWFSGDRPGYIDIQRVTCHELGHALGMGHLPANPPQLMSPTYSPTIMGPRDGDIAEMVQRYGRSKVSVPVPGGPDVPSKIDWASLLQPFLSLLAPIILRFLSDWISKHPQQAAEALSMLADKVGDLGKE